MKDYKFIGRYKESDWENDLKWKAMRLDFIWRFASSNPIEYVESGMPDEKHDFYAYDEIVSAAYNL